jgi:hypothetical protein
MMCAAGSAWTDGKIHAQILPQKQTRQPRLPCLDYVKRLSPTRLFNTVFLAEFLDTACGVNNLLLAGIERMAFRAYFNMQIFRHGGARGELVTAAAYDRNFWVIRVNFGFHDLSSVAAACTRKGGIIQ